MNSSGVSDRAALDSPKIFRGWGLDTCNTPSQRTLRAWKHSKYRAIGVYYGGRGRSCKKQSHLSHAWMRATRRLGWYVLPLYVGSQAPCVVGKDRRHHTIGSRPWRQGEAEARDAIRRARPLGIAGGSPIYLDMEAYKLNSKPCARATLRFVRGWSREVRHHGYLPGFYGSADSGVRHLEQARRSGVGDLPAVMWFARWHGKPSLYGEPELSGQGWRPHRRIHQYAGNVVEKHGGRKLHIDRNKVDAPVAVIR
nr:DUF1906 domain-containing protein [Streptomyces sp. MST-110588]